MPNESYPKTLIAKGASDLGEALSSDDTANPDTQDKPPSSSVDLKMLSQHLGLSKGTISRALNGYPEIAERTRARVLKVAEELGYSPNRAARRLATGRNDLISYVGVGADWMIAERTFLSSASATLAEQGYGLMVSLADSMASAEETMRQLIADRRVDGFILSAPFPMDGRIAIAKDAGVPAVVVGGMLGDTVGDMDGSKLQTGSVPVVGINDRAVLDGLVDYLNSLGHASFAYFGCDAPRALQSVHSKTLAASCSNRATSFTSAMRPELANLEMGERLDPETAGSLNARATALLSRRDDRPTAIFCGCERTVVALYMEARNRGISIPEEVSIIGIGPSQLASWLSGGLSTVSWSLSEAGRLCGDCIMGLVDGKMMDDIQARVEAEFLARASHGPAPRISPPR
ncbi:MAG: LacI family DNA-binding transcriptional regulator [Pseudomonadota bacterium]